MKTMTRDSHNKKQKILALLDSHAILHRSYHALPKNFTSPSGTATGALYGFSSFLIRILKELKPDYIAACYDLPEPTFRHIAYKKYKEKRPKMDPDLAVQINRSKEILQAFGIPVFEFAGFEADDILGTIVKQVESAKDLKIIIASGDLDTLQLVHNNQVVVYTLKKGITDAVIYNEEAVKKRFGFGPKSIPDFKAIAGDSSDNIPGIKGIGDKTAKELLRRFHSLEEIYKNLEASPDFLKKAGVKERVIELLKKNKEEAFFCRVLAEIRKDAPIEFNLNLFQNKARPPKQEVIKIFEELGFRSLINRLNDINFFFGGSELLEMTPPSALTEASSSPGNPDFKEVLKISKEFFWFISPEKTEFVGMADVLCALKNGKIFRFTDGDFKKEKIFFGKIFEDVSKKHYAFDAKNLEHYFEKFGISPNFNFDAFVAAWILNSELNSPKLEDVFRIFEIPLSDSGEKLFECRKCLLEKLEKENLLEIFNNIEMPLIKILAEMERNGILIDAGCFKKLSLKCGEKLKKIENKIWTLVGEKFNVNSTKETRRILFEKLAISAVGVRKTDGGVRSTKFSELIKMRGKHPVIEEIISFRELAKLKSTYIDALPLLAKENRIHTAFNQTGTVTGRLSSSNPNLQNIPMKGELAAEIRKCFIAEKGWKLAFFDYSQIELRLAAYLSGDEKMSRAFAENQDIHSITASEIFNVFLKDVLPEMRKKAKVINFGILYGMGVRALSESLGITKQEAEIYRDEYFNDFKGVADYIKKTIEEAKATGYVKSLFGRKRHLRDIFSQNDFVRKEAERMAINMPIQGTAADIIKIAMIKIDEFLEKNPSLKNQIKTILQIHDELIFEIRKNAVGHLMGEIKNIMQNVLGDKLKLPVEFRVADNWG